MACPGLSQTLGTVFLLYSFYLGLLGSLCWPSYSAIVMAELVDRHYPAGLGAQWQILSEVVDSVLEPGSHFLCDLGEEGTGACPCREASQACSQACSGAARAA